jgi:hypothetical protein
MINRKFKNVVSTSRDPYGPAPQQMSLFPDEKPGRSREQMRIKSLLKAHYKTAHKTADNTASAEQAD